MSKAETTTGQRPEQAATKQRRRPGQSLVCGWCGGEITVRATGRTPKWCSDTCRHRAWETTRAANAGRLAVQVVDRLVEVEVPVTVIETVEIPTTPKGAHWISALHELARQLDAGKIYDRDLPALTVALNEALDAYARRPAVRTRQHTRRD